MSKKNREQRHDPIEETVEPELQVVTTPVRVAEHVVVVAKAPLELPDWNEVKSSTAFLTAMYEDLDGVSPRPSDLAGSLGTQIHRKAFDRWCAKRRAVYNGS